MSSLQQVVGAGLRDAHPEVRRAAVCTLEPLAGLVAGGTAGGAADVEAFHGLVAALLEVGRGEVVGTGLCGRWGGARQVGVVAQVEGVCECCASTGVPGVVLRVAPRVGTAGHGAGGRMALHSAMSVKKALPICGFCA